MPIKFGVRLNLAKLASCTKSPYLNFANFLHAQILKYEHVMFRSSYSEKSIANTVRTAAERNLIIVCMLQVHTPANLWAKRK